MKEFPPPRHGQFQQVILIVFLATACGEFVNLATHEPIGLRFSLFLVGAGIAFFPLPFLAYRFYALNRANYSLDRDKLTISWGMRIEQIPLSDVEWVRPLTAMPTAMKIPRLHLPGALTGLKHYTDLGRVEFLASDSKTLLLVATAKRIFAISPMDPNSFMQTIQQAMEMGSLSQSEPKSVYPVNTIGQAWENILTRYLWLAGLFMNTGLLIWVTFLVPGLAMIPLGFNPQGLAGEPVPGSGLILLPVVSIAFFIISWLVGLFFFRRADRQVLAFLTWGGSVIASLIFLLAVMFIVTTPL
jgi:hypothetical protein